MKVTVRALLFNENDTDEAPVKLVVWHNGKRIVHSLNIKLVPSFWNAADRYVKKTHPNHITYNRIIENKITEVNDYVDALRSQREEVSLFKIRQFLKGDLKEDDVIKYTKDLFKAIEQKDAKGSRKYSIGSIKGWKSCLKKLQSYKSQISFSEVDTVWLRKYESWLRSEQKRGKKKYYLSNNTVHRHWKFLRKIFNLAISDGVTQNYPFKKVKDGPKYKQGDVTWHPISVADKLEQIINSPISEAQRTIVNYYLLSFYSGLRLSDLYRYNPKGFIRNGRLLLRTKKTGEWVDIDISKSKRLAAVIERIGETPLEFSEKTIRDNLTTIGKILKIGRLNPHSGRHSFAVRCAEVGISQEDTAEFMGISFRTCGVYYKIANPRRDSEISKWDSQPATSATSS